MGKENWKFTFAGDEYNTIQAHLYEISIQKEVDQ